MATIGRRQGELGVDVMSKIKVCFVVPYGYPLFNAKADTEFGGAEVRAITFAKALAEDPGYDVTVMVRDQGQPKIQRCGRITVRRTARFGSLPAPVRMLRKLVSRRPRFPYLAFRRWEGSLLWLVPTVAAYMLWSRSVRYVRNLRGAEGTTTRKSYPDYLGADADIYCMFGVSELSADLAAFCESERRAFVLFLASEYDLSDFYRPGSQKTNIYGAPGGLCFESLVKADVVITQTEAQIELLKKRFSRAGVVIRNPIDLVLLADPSSKRSAVLWIGRTDPNKRPELFIELARRFRNQRFVLVLNRFDENKFADILRTAPENVTIVERLSFAETEQLFAQALVLVNTSGFEGFPNTFLQAGKYAVPILSMSVDPDGFITEHSCGIVAQGSFERLVDGLQKLVSDPGFHARCAANVSAYVRNHHEVQERLSELKSLFHTLHRRHEEQEPVTGARATNAGIVQV